MKPNAWKMPQNARLVEVMKECRRLTSRDSDHISRMREAEDWKQLAGIYGGRLSAIQDHLTKALNVDAAQPERSLMDVNRLTYCSERLDDVINRINPILRKLESQTMLTEQGQDFRDVLYAMKDLVEAITGLRDSEAG